MYVFRPVCESARQHVLSFLRTHDWADSILNGFAFACEFCLQCIACVAECAKDSSRTDSVQNDLSK